MSDKNLHIITLDIPYPADYGGMIDSFNRIKSLSTLGIKIHLHCFEYGRTRPEILEKLCSTVSYHPRTKGIASHISALPHNVISRKHDKLLELLRKDDFPILFDGLHTAWYIDQPGLNTRKKLIRSHNIEHRYLRDRAASEKNIYKSIYYLSESIRFSRYEKVLLEADKILAISATDNDYFSRKYGNSALIMPFHPFDNIESQAGYGQYILYHGNLSINLNNEIVRFLIKKVFLRTDHKYIIAGMNPSPRLKAEIQEHPNIRLVPDPGEKEMMDLIRGAHITLPLSSDNNGLKLKLLFSIFAGRHCIVNDLSSAGNPLRTVCHEANSAVEIIRLLNSLMEMPFTQSDIEQRQILLNEHFNNMKNGEKIIDLIFT